MYVRHIKDLNEITSHMLEVVRSQLGLLGKVIGLMGGYWANANNHDGFKKENPFFYLYWFVQFTCFKFAKSMF